MRLLDFALNFTTSNRDSKAISGRERGRKRLLLAEQLEDRNLLAIVWGNDYIDSSFESQFGSNAPAARTIVRNAIADWNRLVDTPQTVNVNFFVTNLGANPSTAYALGATDANITHDAYGRPTNATIWIDEDGAGSHWYFDPTPTSDSEYNNLLTVFTGTRSFDSTQDLYSTVAHELGHAMDLGHSVNAVDLMGTQINPGTRKLISQEDVNAVMAQFGSVGYSALDPTQVDTLYVNQEPGTNQITVIGFAGANNDTITVSALSTGSLYNFNVNGSNEITNTGPISISSGSGNDFITMDATSGLLYQAMTINGGAGDDLLVYNGGATGGTFDYTYASNQIQRPRKGGGSTPYAISSYSGFEDVALLAGATADVVNVSGSSGAQQLRLYLKEGNDTLNATTAYTPLRVVGGSGDDTLYGGYASDLLIGNDGNDTIVGNGGRDFLIGGIGSDLFLFNPDGYLDDLIVTGYTTWDSTDVNPLLMILSEWNSTRTPAVKYANITGNGTGPRNNGNVFLVQSISMWQDNDVDTTHADGQDWVVCSTNFDITTVP